jgi:hypothetical protein
MDPDDRLTEKLGEELRRSMAEIRLHHEFREELKGRLLATPPSRWRRWLNSWPALARHRGALAGIAVAAIAAAVLVPLATFHPAHTSRGRQYLELVPPGVSGAHAAAAAPATCHSGTVHLQVATVRVILTTGQSDTVEVRVTGSSCPLGASVTGPSRAGISIKPVPESSSNPAGVAQEAYQLIWTGKSAAAPPRIGGASGSSPKGTTGLSAGTYTVILSVPPASARVAISFTIRK